VNQAAFLQPIDIQQNSNVGMILACQRLKWVASRGRDERDTDRIGGEPAQPTPHTKRNKTMLAKSTMVRLGAAGRRGLLASLILTGPATAGGSALAADGVAQGISATVPGVEDWPAPRR
jgi:hypothetical protein